MGEDILKLAVVTIHSNVTWPKMREKQFEAIFFNRNGIELMRCISFHARIWGETNKQTKNQPKTPTPNTPQNPALPCPPPRKKTQQQQTKQ